MIERGGGGGRGKRTKEKREMKYKTRGILGIPVFVLFYLQLIVGKTGRYFRTFQ